MFEHDIMAKTEKMPHDPTDVRYPPDGRDARFHAKPVSEVSQALENDADEGLTEQAVRARRERYGRNRLRKTKRRSAWALLLDQFKSLVLLVLAVAGSLVPFVVGQILLAALRGRESRSVRNGPK